MIIEHLMKLESTYNIQVFEEKQDISHLTDTHVCFTGTPKKHPDNDAVIILITNYLGSNPLYNEFKLADISYVEKVSNEVTLDGDTVPIVRLWVKKGSVGVHCIPFVVEQISKSKLL